MFLEEGAKVSNRLIKQAFSDPAMTMGFEAEFFVVGFTDMLEKLFYKNSKDGKKKLGDLSWYDLIWSFEPQNVPRTDNRDNQEVIRDRIASAYAKSFPDKEVSTNFQSMFNELREKFKPYHIMALLNVFPENGFAEMDPTEETLLLRAISSGNMMKMSAYKYLDEEMYLINYFDKHAVFDVFGVSREILYLILTQHLSDYLGQEVVYVPNPESVKQMTGNYEKWALTYDPSLESDPYEDTIGLELIAPKRQIEESWQNMQRLLRAIRNFGSVIKGMSAETTNKTGFHITIGVQGREVDFTKLLFLMGDEYLAKNFNRLHDEGEQFAAQTYLGFVQALSRAPRELDKIISRMDQKISLSQKDIDMVLKLIRKHIPKGKYQSVNLTKLNRGVIEFRSPGNADYEGDEKRIAETVQRLVVMMFIATNPEIYRQEYYKKIYRTVVQVGKEYLEQTGQDFNYQKFVKMSGDQMKKPFPDEEMTESESQNSRMIQMYHVTPTQNVRSIMSTGLIPQVGDRSSKVDEQPGIHLFADWDTMEDAVMNWMGDEFEDDELTLLQVMVQQDEVEEDVFYPGHIYISDKPIPPEHIKVLDYEL